MFSQILRCFLPDDITEYIFEIAQKIYCKERLLIKLKNPDGDLPFGNVDAAIIYGEIKILNKINGFDEKIVKIIKQWIKFAGMEHKTYKIDYYTPDECLPKDIIKSWIFELYLAKIEHIIISSGL